MIPKFSVKKPYTVIVGIILVLVLGVVSLTKLSTDLLPEMNLPYAVVMTTYVGASPDTVEEEVTIPVEESMATVSGIDTMYSYSSENYSLVVLAFDEETNMDSITLDIREQLDQLESFWSDGIGSPLILKINPNMSPVIVASVAQEDMSQQQLTDYVEDTLIAQLESLNGVASVSAAGEIESQIKVIIRQDKIDKLNEQIVSLLDDKFADAQAELDDGKAEVEDGKDELEDQSEDLSNQLAEGSDQVIDSKIEIFSTKSELEKQLQTMEESLDQLDSALSQIAQAEAGLTTINSTLDTLEDVYSQVVALEATKLQAQDALDQILAAQGTEPAEPAEPAEPGLPMEPVEPETPPETPAVPDTAEQADTAASNSTSNPTETQIAQLKATIESCDQALNTIAEALAQQGLTLDTSNGLAAGLKAKITELEQSKQELEAAVAQKATLEENRAQLVAGIGQVEDALTQIESGQVSLSEALTTINKSGILASIQLGSASAQLAAAESALDNAQEQLDSSMESAYDSLDADAILTVNTISSLLTAQDFEMPAGYITEGEDSLLVRVGDSIQNLDELKSLPLMNLNLEGLDTIRLEDVADIIVTDNSEDVYAKVNGDSALILSLVKQDGYSTGDVSNLIQDRFAELEEENPGLHFTVLSDQGIYIDMVIHSVLQSMIYGAILAVVVLFLFLKDLRPTMVIACSIPVSVVLALVFMYMSGITLNMMSLGGLSLGIGMLVDNSVVVLENIYRYRTLGYDIRSAAVAGTKEVTGAIVASTLTTVSVFVGLFFTSGIVMELFVALALTIFFSLMGSLIIALTFVPMMSSKTMGKSHEIGHPWFEKFTTLYSKALDACLRKKVIVILLAIALLVISGSEVLSRGFIFMPDMESSQASVSITTPEELTFSETMEIADQVSERLLTIPDVETVGVQSGSSGMMSLMVSSVFGGSGSGDTDANAASFYVVFADERTMDNEEFAAAVAEKTADLDCEVTVDSSSMDLSALMGNGITIQVFGKDKDTLQQIARDLGSSLEQVAGVSEVENGLQQSSEQLKVTVDKEKAAEYSLTVAQVFQTIYSRIATPTSITTLELEEGHYDLYVTKDTDEEMQISDLKEVTFDVTNADGDKETIPLSDIAEISSTTGLDTINRYNQQRYLSLTAYVDDNYNVTKVSSAIQESVDQFDMPDGYYVSYSGESETIMESMEQLSEMLLLAV
ncbi:MAG: efflux RND transporter permease subunit, partial [Candidatus Onthomonas sp.]